MRDLLNCEKQWEKVRNGKKVEKRWETKRNSEKLKETVYIAQIPVQQKSLHRTLFQQKFMILWSMDICWELVDQWYLRASLNQLGYYPAKTTSQHYKLRFNWKCQWFTFSVDSLQQKLSWKAALACTVSNWYIIWALVPNFGPNPLNIIEENAKTVH